MSDIRFGYTRRGKRVTVKGVIHDETTAAMWVKFEPDGQTLVRIPKEQA